MNVQVALRSYIVTDLENFYIQGESEMNAPSWRSVQFAYGINFVWVMLMGDVDRMQT